MRVRAGGKGSLGSHAGELLLLLLLVIHDLLAGWLGSGLLWGRVVEGGSSIVGKAVAGGVHGVGASGQRRLERQCVSGSA